MGLLDGPQTGIVAELARAELTAITTITPDINALERRLRPLVLAAAPALLDMYGCATRTAARIVGETADISRFRSESAFVRYAGLAPVPHWSGGAHGRLRAHKGGNRRLNSALHQAALVRIKAGGSWADEYRRRRESDSHPRVMRRLNASWHGRCISASATATPDTRSRRPSPTSSCAANVVATFPHGRPQHTAARAPAPPTAKPTGGRDRCGVCGADRPQPRLVDRPRTRALTSQHRWRSVERPTLWG